PYFTDPASLRLCTSTEIRFADIVNNDEWFRMGYAYTLSVNTVQYIERPPVSSEPSPVTINSSNHDQPPVDATADLNVIGAELHRMRVDHGLSVQDLAEASGISTGMISQIERGLANPSINTISKLATALGLQLGIFF